MPNITPFLWFDTQAEQAARFYTSVFKDSKTLAVARYAKGSPGMPGSVMTMRFRILGQEFTALNGGPAFKITPAISFVVHCKTQREVDFYWRKLSAGGKKVRCGWLEDKFGLSWQIVPNALVELLTVADSAKAERVMKAVMKRVKLDIKRLLRAAAEGSEDPREIQPSATKDAVGDSGPARAFKRPPHSRSALRWSNE